MTSDFMKTSVFNWDDYKPTEEELRRSHSHLQETKRTHTYHRPKETEHWQTMTNKIADFDKYFNEPIFHDPFEERKLVFPRLLFRKQQLEKEGSPEPSTVVSDMEWNPSKERYLYSGFVPEATKKATEARLKSKKQEEDPYENNYYHLDEDNVVYKGHTKDDWSKTSIESSVLEAQIQCDLGSDTLSKLPAASTYSEVSIPSELSRRSIDRSSIVRNRPSTTSRTSRSSSHSKPLSSISSHRRRASMSNSALNRSSATRSSKRASKSSASKSAIHASKRSSINSSSTKSRSALQRSKQKDSTPSSFLSRLQDHLTQRSTDDDDDAHSVISVNSSASQVTKSSASRQRRLQRQIDQINASSTRSPSTTLSHHYASTQQAFLTSHPSSKYEHARALLKPTSPSSLCSSSVSRTLQ
mmetsp:Transcript_4498/g.6614  ORF Transcript_4498/g.6614 Transcript_4498/m.6614 type:complete len:413 (-) Transcript_4498:3717-4955(-)